MMTALYMEILSIYIDIKAQNGKEFLIFPCLAFINTEHRIYKIMHPVPFYLP